MKRIIIAALLLVSGCHRAVTVQVSELPNDRLSIVAVESGQSAHPCVYQVRLYRRSAESRLEIWNIALKQQDKCRGAFTYPDTADGYEAVVSAGAGLHTGDQLEVEISGSGFETSTRLVKR